ncbi:Cuticle Protein CPR RR-1 13 [Frankliniella occidentalis]|uniref:Larval cuticle protein LCP-17-like isoform X1 n=1 Tax=Frankliniella occidentalis TaxID=133901 RepID=A0A6J1RV27_FRAOC|nr:larval cuticle protein LCP-17-like isoform X1 [Frankliniella occidentalis]KAE8739711.1 Cuticle Protein CPR RR-1 13 [Frankliniella occidentalis]
MKFLIVLTLVAAASAAPQFFSKEVRKMVVPSGAWEHHEEHREIPQARMLVQGKSHGAVLTKEGGAQIVEVSFDMDEPGRYLYHFKTNNGIAKMEQAALEKDAGKVQGSYEWTSPEGQNFKLEYVADELGFHPVAAHLPVAPAAPEIPVAIQRSLEWNAAHPEEDDSQMYEQSQSQMYAQPQSQMYVSKKIMY